MAFVAIKIVQVRQAPVVTGSSELVGEVGVVRERSRRTGLVFVHGELWRARATTASRSGRAHRCGSTQIDDGLVLEVEPAERPGPVDVGFALHGRA